MPSFATRFRPCLHPLESREVPSVTRISTDAAGNQAAGASLAPVYSPDGLFVAFESAASNLVPGDTNGLADIFIKNLSTGAITRVSTDASGNQATQGSPPNSDGVRGSHAPAFSPDGTKLVFVSGADNLVPGDTNTAADIFVKTLATGAIVRASTDASGNQSNIGAFTVPNSGHATFSPDGTRVVFESAASNLVPGDTNGYFDVFVKTLATGAFDRVSTDSAGHQATSRFRVNGSFSPRFSPDGRSVLFESTIGFAATPGYYYLKNLATRALTVLVPGGPGNGNPFFPSLPAFSPDGRTVAFASTLATLVPGDTNGAADVFVTQVVNTPPTITATGGPYSVLWSDPLTLSATATDADADPLTYTWDVNGDGVFGDATGATVTLTPAQRQALGIGRGYSGTVRVRVSDLLSTVTASTTLRVSLETLTAVGAGPGGAPHVKVYNADGSERFTFFAYDPAYTGGVVVATADVNGDGVEDVITGTMGGGAPHVKLFDGVTGKETRSFFAFSPAFTGGVSLAAADLDGDKFAEIVVGAGPGGGPHVKVYNGKTELEAGSFFAYSPAFTGGVTVGVANGMIVTGARSGAAPHVKVFAGAAFAEVKSFFAFDPSFGGGVNVAAGDFTGDGVSDYLIGQASGGSQVKVVDGVTGAEQTLAPFGGFGGGIRVATDDLNGDGRSEMAFAAGPSGGPRVKVLRADGTTVRDFFAFDAGFTGGVNVG